MRSIFYAVAAAVLILPSAPVQGRDLVTFNPSSQWVLNYADERCRLARNFGEGNRKITLIMEQFEPTDWFQVIFVGDSLALDTDGYSGEGEIRFGPYEEKSDIRVMPGSVSGVDALFVIGGVRVVPLSAQESEASARARRRGDYYESPPVPEAREKAATWLELKETLKFDVVLQTSAMDRAAKALDDCTWDLVKSWGLDVEQQRTLSRKADPIRSSAWFSTGDYPASALRSSAQADVRYRAIVDEEGRPESCHIQKATEPDAFEKVVCKSVMRRGRFRPALDAQGRPVRSYYSGAVSYRVQS